MVPSSEIDLKESFRLFFGGVDELIVRVSEEALRYPRVLRTGGIFGWKCDQTRPD